MGGEMREHFTKFMRMLTDSCRCESRRFVSSLDLAALRNKPFMDWLVKEQFDIAFAHPYHMCPIGLIHHAQIPTWIWLQRWVIRVIKPPCQNMGSDFLFHQLF